MSKNDVRSINIETLLPILENLIRYGAVQAPMEYRRWLQQIGVTEVSLYPNWVVPTAAWLESALPAMGPVDLLRRTAVRDLRYRLHVDAMIASVLHAIGVSRLWKRLEQLLLGRFKPFAPRFVQLLEWQERRTGKPVHQLGERAWQQADVIFTEGVSGSFFDWDEMLWGAKGNPNTLFPLLGDLYIPVMDQPIHIDPNEVEMADSTCALLEGLVEAAKQGEGLLLSGDVLESARVIQDLGLPLRILPLGDVSGQAVAGLIGRVSIPQIGRVPKGTFSQTPFSGGMPEPASKSLSSNSGQDGPLAALDLWGIIDKGHRIHAFMCVDDGPTGWPETQNPDSPPWATLPGRDILGQIGRPRSLSPAADEALLTLGNHPLYGFLIQVLLLEALDRELGEETLMLAPPIDRKVDDLEASTRVFYRRRLHQGSSISTVKPSSYQIGALDEVLTSLAQSAGISGIAYAYKLKTGDPWTRSFKLLRSALIISARHDRWTLAGHVLDRLHGGGLMTNIIRRGHPLREQFHRHLEEWWEQRDQETRRQEVAVG
jgi:hypothetical protein